MYSSVNNRQMVYIILIVMPPTTYSQFHISFRRPEGGWCRHPDIPCIRADCGIYNEAEQYASGKDAVRLQQGYRGRVFMDFPRFVPRLLFLIFVLQFHPDK